MKIMLFSEVNFKNINQEIGQKIFKEVKKIVNAYPFATLTVKIILIEI